MIPCGSPSQRMMMSDKLSSIYFLLHQICLGNNILVLAPWSFQSYQSMSKVARYLLFSFLIHISRMLYTDIIGSTRSGHNIETALLSRRICVTLDAFFYSFLKSCYYNKGLSRLLICIYIFL